MIFTVQVVNKDNQQSEETLALIRYTAGKTSGKETNNATMRRLMWETVLSVVRRAADSQAIEL